MVDFNTIIYQYQRHTTLHNSVYGWMQGNGTIPLRAQVQLFAETKATIIQSGLVSHKRLEDLLSQSLFLISSGGNDLAPFDIAGVPMSQAPEFITGIVADYVKYISVCVLVYKGLQFR